MKRTSSSTFLSSPQAQKKFRYDIRTDLQKEVDEELYREITTNASEIIMPYYLNKYYGFAQKIIGRNKWSSQFAGNHKGKYTHNSEEEAINHVKEVNIKMGWNIKNIVYRYGNEYYCALPYDRLMLFSPNRMDVIQENVWCGTFGSNGGKYYACTNIKGSRSVIKYHQAIHPNIQEPQSIDHINNITEDNRDENLRVVSKSIQNINRGVIETNRTGVTGVHMAKNTYRATWTDENGIQKIKSYSTLLYGKEEALSKATAFRRQMEETLPHYLFALKNI